MVDSGGIQMLHHHESGLLFRLIGRRPLETFRRHPWAVYGSFSPSQGLSARDARSSYLPAISRIVCSLRVSRMSFAIARACAASFSHVTEFSIPDVTPVVPMRAKRIGGDSGIVMAPVRISPNRVDIETITQRSGSRQREPRC